MDLQILILIFVLHFVADFVLQTDDMALNKSSSNYWLTVHAVVYSLTFAIFFGPLYALINGVLHWVTDYTTSRIAAHFYKNNKRSLFFQTIGFDQMIHMVTLTATYHWMFLS